LALVAPLTLFWRRQRSVAFFAALGLAVLILARREPTPLHAALSLLPGFENIHARSPERALIVFYIAPALLAGATVSALDARGRLRGLATVAGLAIVAIVAVDLHIGWMVQAAQALAGGGDYQFQ